MKKIAFILFSVVTVLSVSVAYGNIPKSTMGQVGPLSPKPVKASTSDNKAAPANSKRKLDIRESLGRGEVAYTSREHEANPRAERDKVRDGNGSKSGAGAPASAVILEPILPNAKVKCITPTYDGSGQAVHPSVIDFKIEYSKEKWQGFRYWMAMTPYPFAIDKYENPSMLASNDGLTWVVPPGFKDPLDIKPGKTNFNSDPALVYDPGSDSIYVYWRESLKGQYDRIWRAGIGQNGKVQPKVMVVEESWADKEGLALSPAIWRKTSDEWYMWTATGGSVIHLYTSKDGVKWSKRERTTLPWLNWNNGFIPWHLDAKPNYRENRVEFFIVGWPRGKGISDMVLFYAEAPMNDPKNLKMPLKDPILGIGPAGNWDDDFIYRPTFVIEREEDSYKYHLWYSARSTLGHWHMGYTEGRLGTSFSPDND